MQTTIRYFDNILERPIFFPLKNEEEGKEKIRENFQNTYSRSILFFFFFFLRRNISPYLSRDVKRLYGWKELNSRENARSITSSRR